MSFIRSFFVGVLCVVMSTASVLYVLAERGPCHTPNGLQMSGSIGCTSSGECIGLKFWIPIYFTCTNSDESNCNNGKVIKGTFYTPKTVTDGSWSSWIQCVGGNYACGTCLATALGVGIFSAGTIGGIIGGGCALVCYGVGNVDPCCRVTCEAIPGASIDCANGCG